MSIQDQHGDDTVILLGSWSGHERAEPVAQRRKNDAYNHPGEYGRIDIQAWYRQGSQWVKRSNASGAANEGFEFPGVTVDFRKDTHVRLDSGDEQCSVPADISMAMALGITAMRVALDPAPTYSW